MFVKFLLLFSLILSGVCLASDYATDLKNENIYGSKENEKLSLYQPTYFIFGLNDLKLQFSFKYRLAKSIPLYFGLTQTMFWNIYEESKPFHDINYFPEVFYRLIDKENDAFKTLDMGYLHSSNGKKGDESRSADRIFIRTNYLTKFGRHDLDFNLMLFTIYNLDNTNLDLLDHIGFWDLKIGITKIIVHQKQSLDLELRFFAGSKVIDFKNGAYQVGLIYNLASANINPAIYLQRYEGYAEHLLDYKKRHSETRFGFLFSY
ncbi:MAG: phospholipase A [Bacteriovorax sp.]|nr:phospholipase A [Bacteriovorax sp.]